jgi:hypothetical protein
MRKEDCAEAKTCHCSCHNCLQYKSTKPKNREDLIMRYVKEYQNITSKAVKVIIKLGAEKNLTEAEFKVFLFEISNNGI